MFASATSGDRYNNNKFSECSKANVSAVLDAITEGRKPNCFTESNGAFCGNKIVEEGKAGTNYVKVNESIIAHKRDSFDYGRHIIMQNKNQLFIAHST